MTIRAEQIWFSYGRIAALRGVSVEARAGELVALVGPNAAGKSTLLRCLLGALKPARGRVLLDGAPLERRRPKLVARRIAYVPQRAEVAASFTVAEVVELGRYALPPEHRRVAAALERMELLELADRPWTALSAGQQQRVTLARALAQLEPGGILLLDEPMSAMDLAHVRHACRVLGEIAAGGATVVVVMHDLPLAASLAGSAWLLDEGTLVAAGPAAQIFTPEQLERVFKVPFIRHGELPVPVL